MSSSWTKLFFVFAGLYDGVLGVAFLLFWPRIYEGFGVVPPNHGAYVQFPALLLLIFAAMFFRIAREPIANRHLIPYGIALKAAYSGLAFWYELTGGVPRMWIPFAWADLAFLVLFLIAWQRLGHAARA